MLEMKQNCLHFSASKINKCVICFPILFLNICWIYTKKDCIFLSPVEYTADNETPLTMNM